ncbi:MAG: amidohydrolase family protein [Planctomycetota bacterium]
MDDLPALPDAANLQTRMIVDLHTRLWTSIEQFGPSAAAQMRRRRTEPWHDHTAAPDEHAQAMTPVSRAVILGFESKHLGGRIDHEEVAAYVANDPDRLLGFAGIDPKAGDPVKSLESALGMGLVGVTVNPAAAGFHPTDTAAMQLFEACQHHHVPVLIESGTLVAREARMEFARPVLLDEVAREFPELKLILGAFGDPWVDEGVALIAKHPTVYGDLAALTQRPWQLLHALLTAHHLGAINQVLFGSNFPFATPEQAIKTMYSINTLTQGTHLPSVPREQLRSIVERDTVAVLGLERKAQPPPPTTETTEPDNTEPTEQPADEARATESVASEEGEAP